jgi:hypothetical protein
LICKICLLWALFQSAQARSGSARFVPATLQDWEARYAQGSSVDHPLALERREQFREGAAAIRALSLPGKALGQVIQGAIAMHCDGSRELSARPNRFIADSRESRIYAQLQEVARTNAAICDRCGAALKKLTASAPVQWFARRWSAFVDERADQLHNELGLSPEEVRDSFSDAASVGLDGVSMGIGGSVFRAARGAFTSARRMFVPPTILMGRVYQMPPPSRALTVRPRERVAACGISRDRVVEGTTRSTNVDEIMAAERGYLQDVTAIARKFPRTSPGLYRAPIAVTQLQGIPSTNAHRLSELFIRSVVLVQKDLTQVSMHMLPSRIVMGVTRMLDQTFDEVQIFARMRQIPLRWSRTPDIYAFEQGEFSVHGKTIPSGTLFMERMPGKTVAGWIYDVGSTAFDSTERIAALNNAAAALFATGRGVGEVYDKWSVLLTASEVERYATTLLEKFDVRGMQMQHSKEEIRALVRAFRRDPGGKTILWDTHTKNLLWHQEAGLSLIDMHYAREYLDAKGRPTGRFLDADLPLGGIHITRITAEADMVEAGLNVIERDHLLTALADGYRQSLGHRKAHSDFFHVYNAYQEYDAALALFKRYPEEANLESNLDRAVERVRATRAIFDRPKEIWMGF